MDMKTLGIVALVVAVIVPFSIRSLDLQKKDEEANKPITGHVEHNPQEQTVDVHINNESTRTYPALDATFYVRNRKPPGAVGEPKEVDRVIFGRGDWIPTKNCYYKSISQIKFPTNDSSIIRVHVVDPNYAGWTFEGNLIIRYGDPLNPKRKDLDIQAYVTASEPVEE